MHILSKHSRVSNNRCRPSQGCQNCNVTTISHGVDRGQKVSRPTRIRIPVPHRPYPPPPPPHTHTDMRLNVVPVWVYIDPNGGWGRKGRWAECKAVRGGGGWMLRICAGWGVVRKGSARGGEYFLHCNKRVSDDPRCRWVFFSFVLKNIYIKFIFLFIKKSGWAEPPPW